MARIEKTVFISNRRKDISWALAVYQYLTSQKYDVFFDFSSLSSGDFEEVIVSNIRARAHFVLILTPTALDRTSELGDWLRREIETAIDEKRNIIPLFFDGFNFGSPSVTKNLTGKLSAIQRYNGLDIPSGYFMEAMERLRGRYLNVPLNAVIHPVSTEVRKVVREEQVAADKALERQREDIKEIVKPAEEKSAKPKQAQVKETTESPSPILMRTREVIRKSNFRYYGIGVGIVLLAVLGIVGINSLIQNIGGSETPLSTIPSTVTTLAGNYIDVSSTDTMTLEPPVLNSTPTTLPSFSHIVREGETCGVIAAMFRVSVQSIIIANQLSAECFVYVGQELIIPYPTPTPVDGTEYGIGSTIISPKDGMVMIYVPAGEFTMGSDTGGSYEKPVHTVFLDSFWIDHTEVTNAMYSNCVKDGECKEPSKTDNYFDPNYTRHPVVYVSWDDASNYCSWADRLLPTEAEWEKAASWDEENQIKRIYPWGDSIDCSFANYHDGSKYCVGTTTNVGNYPNGLSPYGALDMTGNVWEWVNDWYASDYYATLGDNASNPLGPSNGDFRVLRGGAWDYGGSFVRSADRNWLVPTVTNNNFGFRCARSP